MYYLLVLGEIYVPKGSRRGTAPWNCGALITERCPNSLLIRTMPQCHLDITGST